MATVATQLNSGSGFTSGEVVTPTKLNDLVNTATVTGIVNADIDAAAAITASKLQNPQYTGFRNAIINGNFDIWQRGTSHSTGGYGSVDRWANQITGTTCTMSRQAFALGQTDVPNEPKYFCRMATTSSAGPNNLAILAQTIESVQSFAGQSVTVSFYAKADAAKPIALELVQFFGTGGSPSSVVTAIGSQKFNLTTSWQKFTATISVPSISGKTLGSNNNDYLEFNIWLDAGSNFNSRTDTLGQQSGTFDIAQVQIEAGSVATPFERRPIGTELALCQRYYQTGLWKFWGYAHVTAAAIGQTISFTNQMRSTPSVTQTTTNVGGTSSVVVEGAFATGFTIYGVASSVGTIAPSGTYAASAEL